MALGLVVMIEGLLYAAFPDKVKVFADFLLKLPTDKIRRYGLMGVGAGLIFVWIILKFNGVN